MEQRKLVELIAKLRDIDKIEDIEEKITVFEQVFMNADAEIRKLMLTDFIRFIKEIIDELESINKKYLGGAK